MANSQTPATSHDGGRPIGHITGHGIGEPSPRTRDPNRPIGRIGPYADVVMRVDGRPVGHWIGLVCPGDRPAHYTRR